MSKWRDFLAGVERKEDLESLIEEVSSEIDLIKPKSVSEEDRLENIKKVISEIKLSIRKLTHKNNVLENKLSILEEDMDLRS
jgi:predicted  nucleic acid-binding Zn-ribbon protein